MIDCLAHRGPNGSRVEQPEGRAGPVALGNSRLAIIDLSESVRMPMSDPETGNWIAYNGEVYNFLDLRAELEGAGVRFRTRTDTEVILKAYGRWGTDCLPRLRGMFALAIWDRAAGQLILARDRLGLKPLYFYRHPGGLLFASEVRALLATGLMPARLDPAGLHTYLWNGFSVAPGTLVEGIRSLLPGHWMRIGSDGSVLESRRYWSLPEQDGRSPTEPEEVRAHLREAVRLRLISDVPLGAFLSGGLDSSTIVALMAEAGAEVRTFSVTFDEPEYDESDFSRWVVRQFRTNHTEFRLRPDSFEAWLPEAVSCLDQPSFDGLNSYYVSRAAREAGLTVALSGLGADEVFGGYPFFRTVPWMARLRGALPRVPPGLIRRWTQGSRSAWSQVAGPAKAAELFRNGARTADHALAAYQVAQMLLPAWARRVLAPSVPEPEDSIWGLPVEFVQALGEESERADLLDRVSRSTLRLFLGERALRDTDTMSMGVSLEVRAPFTDHELLAALLRQPARQRTRGAPHKAFEQELVGPILGPEYPWHRKMGFSFPFERWLRRGRASGWIAETMADERNVESAGLDPIGVGELTRAFRAPGSRVPWSRMWALFVLVEWCRRYGVSR
jgi:asparagine synthase (glutamine-hydrolysing)